MKKNLDVYIALLYLLGGIITFGHSAANPPEKCLVHGEYVKCRGVAAGFNATPTVLLWPLYVSWVIWEKGD